MASPTVDFVVKGNLVMHDHSESDLGAILDDRYVNVTGDTMTGTLNIQVPTTTSEALILQTTDDNTTKNLFEVKDSGGSVTSVLTTDNRLGVGTGSPTDSLTVKGKDSVEFNFFDGAADRTPYLSIEQGTNAVGLITGSATSIFGYTTGKAFGIGHADYSTITGGFLSSLTYAIYVDKSSNGSKVGINETSSVAQLHVTTGSATRRAFVVKGAASQTANLTEWQDSSGNVLASIGSGGDFTVGDRNSIRMRAVIVEDGVSAETSAVLVGGLQDRALAIYGDGAAYYMGRDVTNNIEFIMGSSNVGAAFVGSMTAHDLQLRTNNTTKLTISHSLSKITVASGQDVDVSGGKLTARGTGTALETTQGNIVLVGQEGTTALLSLTASVNQDTQISLLGDRDFALQVDGNASLGTADYFHIYDITATASRITINTDGDVGINEVAPGAQLQTTISGAAVIGQIIKAAASQTANLTEWQDSSANVLSGVDERGILFSDGGTDASNTFIGSDAGNTTATGTNNVAIGVEAGQDLTTGNTNTLIGYRCGRNITQGINNFGLGSQALDAVTTGNNNVAIGNTAIFTGNPSNSVAIGDDACRDGPSNCVGIGFAALDNTTGAQNVAIGVEAGHNTGTGVDNVAIGYGTMDGVGNKSNNVIIGTQAGTALTTGSSNIFIGRRAGFRQTTNSNLLIVDVYNRADVATEQTHAIIYGVTALEPEDQSLRFNADTFSFGTDADADITVNFLANSNSGVLTWMEDEDYFDFADTVKTSAGRIRNTTTVNAATYDLLASDDILLVTYTGTGAVTSLTLPSAQCVDGRTIVIVDAGGNAATNNITVDTEGAETISGSATYTLNNDYESITLVCDGSNYYVI